MEEDVEEDIAERKEREQRQRQLELIEAIIGLADEIDKVIEATPADPDAEIELLSRLANRFPYKWENWLFAEKMMPHRVAVAYAKLRRAIVPFMVKVDGKRAGYPASPDNMLKTLATAFRFTDMETMQRIEREVPMRLAEVRSRAAAVTVDIKEMTDPFSGQRRKLERELSALEDSLAARLGAGLRGRDREGVKADIAQLDEVIEQRKQEIVALQKRADAALQHLLSSLAEPRVEALLVRVGGTTPPSVPPAAPPPVPRRTELRAEADDAEELLGESVDADTETVAPLPPAVSVAEPAEEPDLWRDALRWSARNRHIVYWALMAVTFLLELFCLFGIAAAGGGSAVVLLLPLAFAPLVLMGLAIERTKKLASYRRLIIGKWQSRQPAGAWIVQFTDDGKLLLNDTITTDFALYVNLDLWLSSEQVRAYIQGRLVSLDEQELVLVVNGALSRFKRLTPVKPKRFGELG